MGLVPTRLTSDDLYVRSFVVESKIGNAGVIFIADSEDNATTDNRHILNEGDVFTVTGSDFADLDAQINLKDIWFFGTEEDDLLVVSYFDISGSLDL